MTSISHMEHPWFDKEKGWIGPAEFDKREFFLAYADAVFKDEDWMMLFILLNYFVKFPFAAATSEGA
ncbi:MAG: hypothetical protein F9K30_22945 [Dechloromonas sp.]|nr:MAG: hypothetical protein F9K30_22945 [Dechloromonas sp.]